MKDLTLPPEFVTLPTEFENKFTVGPMPAKRIDPVRSPTRTRLPVKAKPLTTDGCTDQRVRVLYPFDMDGNSGKCTGWVRASTGLSCWCIRIALGKGRVARAQLDVPIR